MYIGNFLYIFLLQAWLGEANDARTLDIHVS